MKNFTDADVEALAKVIWNISRVDEGTISATGARHVAEQVLLSDWFAEFMSRPGPEVEV